MNDPGEPRGWNGIWDPVSGPAQFGVAAVCHSKEMFPSPLFGPLSPYLRPSGTPCVLPGARVLPVPEPASPAVFTVMPCAPSSAWLRWSDYSEDKQN